MYEYPSSNHYSHEQQVADVLAWMDREMPDEYAAILSKFPEMDTDADRADVLRSDDVDIELSSWIADEIENTTPVYWSDGEPRVVAVTLVGGSSYAIGDPEYFSSIRSACEAWLDRHISNGRRAIDGICYPCYGDGMEMGDYAVVGEYEGITVAETIAIAEYGDSFASQWTEGDDQ